MTDPDALWSLFPPGFTYRPPVEELCGCCGAKHMGASQTCSPCQNALASGK